jgi:hypothetical protein
MTGYASAEYARSLADVGKPRELACSGGWLLERAITASDAYDAMGCYPFFACRDWSQLARDIETLGSELVSVTIVTDPFAHSDAAALQHAFPDLCRPYKEHLIADLGVATDSIAVHHRRNARRALENLDIDQSREPSPWLDDWCKLYAELVARHEIHGVAAFSRASFAAQLRVPGIVALRAASGDTCVGMTLWYCRGDIAYYHLGAYSSAGYALRASFALFWRARELFSSDNIRWLSLGAGAGAAGDPDDGLTRFKRGWATGTRTVYLCGRILNAERYAALSARRAGSTGNYFPAYRAGESR